MIRPAIYAPEINALRAISTRNTNTLSHSWTITAPSRMIRHSMSPLKETGVGSAFTHAHYLSCISKAECCRLVRASAPCWASDWKMLRNDLLPVSQSHPCRPPSVSDSSYHRDLDFSLHRPHLAFVTTRQSLLTHNHGPWESPRPAALTS